MRPKEAADRSIKAIPRLPLAVASVAIMGIAEVFEMLPRELGRFINRTFLLIAAVIAS
jgi:hypothetical protein